MLFGGASPTNLLNDTWEWDGLDWVNVVPSSVKPLPQHGRALAYDSGRKRLVLVGADDTWEWDGAVWAALTPNVAPWCSNVFYTGTSACPVVFDEAHQRLLTFDGENTWVYLR